MRIQQASEGNPNSHTASRSQRRYRGSIPSRYVFVLGFVGCLVGGIVLFYGSMFFSITNLDVFTVLLFSAILFFIIAGTFAVVSVLAWGVEISGDRSRLRAQRARHRLETRRRYRTLQRQRSNAESSKPTPSIPDDGEAAEYDNEEDARDQDLPKWLIPLLKNRPAALAIHDELIVTSQSRDEIESKFQSHIDDLDSEKVIIRYEEPDSFDVDVSSKLVHTEALTGAPSARLSETEIEREAILNLLGALELQHSENRISPSFYKRKRKQLRKRLAEITRKSS